MITLPTHLIEETTFNDASHLISAFGGNDLLQGMEWIKEQFESAEEQMGEDAFLDAWAYEINAYNEVFKGMSKLFHGE